MDVSTLAVALGYTKKQIEQAKREGFRVQIEQDRSILETTGEEKVFYFLPKNPQKPKDGYDEFVYTNNAWEQVGVTDVDLSAYALKSEIPTIDSTLTVSGAAADAKVMGDKIGVLDELVEPYNLYNPNEKWECCDYQWNQVDGNSPVAFIQNGNLIVKTSAQSSFRGLKFPNKKIQPGTYTISGKITLHSDVEDRTRQVRIKLGTANYVDPFVTSGLFKTERVDDSEKTGWFHATVSIDVQQPLAIGVVPFYYQQATGSMPATISELQIISGDTLYSYSEKKKSSVDVYARGLMDSIYEQSLTSVKNNTFVSDYSEADFYSHISAFNDILLNTSKDRETFLFFTDPHLAKQSGGTFSMENMAVNYINFIEKIYNSAPLSFCLDGGDWLGNGDSLTTAASKLSYIDGFCRKKIKNYLPMLGNHDTNYQGSQRFTVDQNIGLYQKFREEKHAYYTYEGPNSKLYIFDTGIDRVSEAPMGAEYSDYEAEQISWFANSLLSDNNEHIIIALHIIHTTGTVDDNGEVVVSDSNLKKMTNKILEIADTYNSRGTITFAGTEYNYLTSTGRVSFCIGGHMHHDYSGTIQNIPFVVTTWVRASWSNVRVSDCSFDMCVIDWTAKKLYMKRVGTGNDREITIL